MRRGRIESRKNDGRANCKKSSEEGGNSCYVDSFEHGFGRRRR